MNDSREAKFGQQTELHSMRTSAMNWKIPLWSAGIGVAICGILFAYTLLVDWNVHFYNPTIENVAYYLIPALILQIATADAPVYDAANQRLTYEIWIFAAVVNASLYGLVGLISATLLRVFRRATPLQ